MSKRKKHNSNIKISDDCIDGMINDGFTIAKIAKTCGVSRQAVHQRVNKDEYKQRLMYKQHYEIIFLYKIGFTPKEIEELLVCNLGKIHNVLNKYNVKKPISTKKIVYTNYDLGMSPKKIAEILNSHIKTIRSYLYKYKNYKPEKIRDKYKHLFEVKFLNRLGFSKKEISEYTHLHISHVNKLLNKKS